MKTTKFVLASLLENKNVLEGNLGGYPKLVFDFDQKAAVDFLQNCLQSDLKKIWKISNIFIEYYEKKVRNTFFLSLTQRRYRKNLAFWKLVALEVSKIRTIRMLEVLVRKEDVKIRRDNLIFIPEAAQEFFDALSHQQQEKLITEVEIRYQRAIQASEYAFLNSEQFEDKQVETYHESCRFWECVNKTIRSPILETG